MFRWLQSLFGSSSSNDETPLTLESLQGKWKMVGVGKNGNFAPPAMVANMKIYMTIEGNRYTVTSDGKVGDRGTIKLDTTQSPVHFDQHITEGDDAGSVHLGIARLRDGVLENLQGDKGCSRPTKFAAKWKGRRKPGFLPTRKNLEKWGQVSFFFFAATLRPLFPVWKNGVRYRFSSLPHFAATFFRSDGCPLHGF